MAAVMASESESRKPLFRDIDADDDVEKTEIESLCVACEEMVSSAGDGQH